MRIIEVSRWETTLSYNPEKIAYHLENLTVFKNKQKMYMYIRNLSLLCSIKRHSST